ncbi:MAG: nucleotide exchange factor GrpE [Limisphaerales bacterium]
MNKEKSNTQESQAAGVPAVATEITPEQLIELETRAAKADENWSRLLQIAADFENFKKRAAREKIEIAQSTTAALLERLLPILDNFEMAQASVQTAQGDKLAAFQTGIAMIQQQLKDVLAASGLEELDASGKPFDPAFHEAVSQMETADAPEGQVVQQLRKGYKLRERLLRPASVVVAKKIEALPAGNG